MSYSPFYRVVVESSGLDITDKITNVSFIDSIEEIDVLALSCNGLSVIDLNTIFLNGVVLNFILGYVGGQQTLKRIGKISNVDVTYGATITANIKVLDLGINTKKGKYTKIWNNRSIKEITTEICKTLNLTLKIEESASINKKIDVITQTNEDNLSFIRSMLKEFSGGDYIALTKDDSLIIKKRNINSTSVRTFEWNNGDGEVITFKPSEKDTSKDEESNETTVSGYNLDTNTDKSVVSNSKNNNQKKLDEYKISYDLNGNEKGRTKITSKIGSKIYSPNTDSDEIKSKSKSKQIDSSLNDMVATLIIKGDPSIMSDSVVTMKNVSNRHVGNWYVSKASHDIKGAYITILELKRDASKLPTNSDTDKNTDVNKTVGDTKNQTKKVISNVINYNINANEKL